MNIYNIDLDIDINRNAYSLLYKKGALVLNSLEIKIGKDKFEKILYHTHKNKINITDKFLDILDNNFGKDLSSYINKLLD